MDKWTEYDKWNAAVAEVMFPELEVPEPVYMDFEEDVLDALATRTGVHTDKVEQAMCEVVSETLVAAGPARIFARHMVRMRSWVRQGRSGEPPFLALLGAFCIAAEQMAAGDGMSSSNYFGRLRAVLGWDPEDNRLDQAYRRVAERLWGELNRWLIELDGQRGLPTAFALNHRFVGLTVSQALVRSGDREKLKEFFRHYGFAPGADVAPTELKLVLDDWFAQTPSPVSAGLARLWRQGQARDRIAQAAAVALASWDGSVPERKGQEGGNPRGQLSLTLEMGGFPRKRFAIQTLLYLPGATTPREAEVLTATPATRIELVPELPGALGLGRGTALHAGDALEGVLRIKDSYTGQTLERRPRRLVLFRQDELSHRWIESPQVMLGDNVRLLVKQDLMPRLTKVLEQVARPGWKILDPYPGQPEGWTVLSEVEVFNHPGALVSTQRMDDLAPLVPLTTSQIKIAGGFALPGQVRGKWHSWKPPEIRAVSDAPEGFSVRLVDLRRFDDDLDDEATETVRAEWRDEGTGVVVQHLAELELSDGDYRVELWSAGSKEALSTTNVLLRSADTPDRRQWALLEPISYGPGLGVLGVPSETQGVGARGHLVEGASTSCPSSTLHAVPRTPHWQVGQRSERRSVGSIVRLTMPDPDSCLYTGRHRELIDMVRTDSAGKPLDAWSYGRCQGCGLVRRYPTRLKRSSYGRPRRGGKQGATNPPRHHLSGLPDAQEHKHDWSTALDAVLHTGGGAWSHLERIAFQIEANALFLDHFARTLEALGQIDVRRDPRTLEAVGWEVPPTALAGTEDGMLFSGYWPSGMYVRIGEKLESSGIALALEEPEDAPVSYFADCVADDLDVLRDLPAEFQVPAVDSAWRRMIGSLSPLGELADALPRQSDSLVGDLSWYRPLDNTWVKVSTMDAPGAYRVRRFSTLDVYRMPEDVERGTVARSTVQLSKHLAALAEGRPLVAYDPDEQTLLVPLGADLPGLYGRALVAASGVPPVAVPSERVLKYGKVPPELASLLYDLLSR